MNRIECTRGSLQSLVNTTCPLNKLLVSLFLFCNNILNFLSVDYLKFQNSLHALHLFRYYLQLFSYTHQDISFQGSQLNVVYHRHNG